MSALGTLGSLLATASRGLRSRLLLTVGSILLASIAIGAAVVGPMYQSGASASYLVTRLRAEPNFITGMVFDYQPPADQLPEQALRRARSLADSRLDDEFGPATLALWSARAKALGGEARVVAAPGSCAHLHIVGRCPNRIGEALILRHDSLFTGVGIGDQLTLKQHSPLYTPYRETLTVVGTYTPDFRAGHYWFNLRDLESIPEQDLGTAGHIPYHPAPLMVTTSTFDAIPSNGWIVRATRRLTVSPQTTLSDLKAATAVVRGIRAHSRAVQGVANPPGTLSPEFGNELVPVSREVQQRRATAQATVAPAVVSVVLVALVLLLRLLTAAMDLRRSELALASLRGFSPRQMWLLGLLEPVLMLVIALPIGVAGGIVAARILAGVWLVPHLPVPFVLPSLLGVVAVVLATLAVAILVVRDGLSEQLSSQIAGVRRPGRSGRWVLLARLVLIAAAVTVLVATLASGKKGRPDATDLALPILLAVAAGLVTTLGAQFLARGWSRWSTRRRGVFGYLASRTIARRREGTLVILPLTAALAIAIFAAGVFGSAAAWRGSDAATLVGADVSYSTSLTMDEAVALTHRIDPDGRWLMAIAAEYSGDGQTMVVDTPRLARVGVWPASWTPGLSAADVAAALEPRHQSVVLRGNQVSLTIDNQVRGHYPILTADLHIQVPDGSSTDVILGPYRRGVSTRSQPLPGCRAGCLVKQVSFGGPAGLTEAMTGTSTLSRWTVDGRPVPAALTSGWRISPGVLHVPPAVKLPPAVSGGRLTVQFSSRTANSYAAITPDDVPLVRPVLLGRTASPTVVGRRGDVLKIATSDFHPLQVRPVARAESMPVLGPAGMMIDYRMLTRDTAIDDSVTFVTILTRSDTPSSVLATLADNGITDATTLSSARKVLDQDAFALALNLYLVVTFIVLLLALAGLATNLTVQMPARRRDAASLRVVGLRKWSIVAAVVAEFVAVLGVAALSGIGAGSLAQYVVVRTVTLGYADTQHTPRLLASLDLANIVELLVATTVVLLLVAVFVAGLTVRGARTASLRETAR